MYVFIRSCIALTRGVVKIIQTDPDSFFSSRSGTLSSTAAPTYHVASPLSFFLSSFYFSLFLSLHLNVVLLRRHRFLPVSRSLAIVPMPNWRSRRSSISRSMTSLPSYIKLRDSRVAGDCRVRSRDRDDKEIGACVEDACRSLRKYSRRGRCRNAKTRMPMFKSLGYLFVLRMKLYSLIYIRFTIIDINFIICKNSFRNICRDFFFLFIDNWKRLTQFPANKPN